MAFGRKSDAQLATRLGELRPGDTIVDVGCGPGVAVRYAARLGARPIGIDPAAVMLRVASLLTRSSAQTRYVEGAAEEIPLCDGCASVVWSIATVHHWSNIDTGLREIRRVLLPRGRLVAIERVADAGARGHRSHGWTDEQAAAFADRCREYGFTSVRLERSTTRRRSTVSVIASAP